MNKLMGVMMVMIAMSACDLTPTEVEPVQSPVKADSAVTERFINYSLNVKAADGSSCQGKMGFTVRRGNNADIWGSGPTSCKGANGATVLDDHTWTRTVSGFSYSPATSSFNVEMFLNKTSGESVECTLATAADLLDGKPFSGTASCTFKLCWGCAGTVMYGEWKGS